MNLTELPLCLVFQVLAQAPVDGDRELARKLEEHRAAVIAKVAPAVCSVMAMKSPGGGSGVLIDPAGHALTNFHVVGELERKLLKVGLPDGFLYLADVLGVDPGGDVALIRLRPREPGQVFPAVELGDSDALKAGEITYAMGNPFLLATDFSPTVTMGIVSGTHRYQGGAGPNQRMLVYPDCIQVDAPVNPGNSGGPLFNDRGQLVGINGRISVRDRGRVNTGVGFAISINQIKFFMPDLRAGRHTEHGTLDMNTWFMTDPNTRNRHGVFVQGMLEDSVAAKAGLQLQDEVLEFNGEKVRSANQLATMIGILPAGFEVLVKYRRFNEGVQAYDEPKSVRIRLAAMDTGSAKAKDERIAPEEFRAFERDRVLGRFATAAARNAGAAGILWSFQRKDVAAGRSTPMRLARRGPDLRVEEGDETMILRGGKAFSLKDGKRSELDENARIHLERLRDLHPLLAGGELSQVMADSLLEGGVFVQGRLASVLALRGEGRRAVYFDEETSLPSGCRFRSPLLKETVEIHVGMAGKVLERVVVRAEGADRFELTPAGDPVAAGAELFEEGS